MTQEDFEAFTERLHEVFEGIEGTLNALDYLEDHCHDHRLSCLLLQIRKGLEKEQLKFYQILGRPAHLDTSIKECVPLMEDVPFD